MNPETQYADYSDLELITALCSTGDDQSLYNELVRRFLPEIKQQCLKKCELQGLDKHIGEEIAHDVFERLRKYKPFKSEKKRDKDDHKAILAYLARFATRLFLNYFDKAKRAREQPDNYLSALRAEAQAADPSRLREIREKTAFAFKKLTDREKAVVIADLEYKKHFKYLPDQVTEELAQRLDVKSATIRKLRQTANQKLQKAFDEINKS